MWNESIEYLVNDRLSFMRFLGLWVPDAKNIWLGSGTTKTDAIGPLFEQFDAMLRDGRYILMSGQIVDASLVAAPNQRNTHARCALPSKRD